MTIKEIIGTIAILIVFGSYVYLIMPKQRPKTINYLRNTTKVIIKPIKRIIAVIVCDQSRASTIPATINTDTSNNKSIHPELSLLLLLIKHIIKKVKSLCQLKKNDT